MATQQASDSTCPKLDIKETSKTLKEAKFGMNELQPVPSLAVGSIEDSAQAVDDAVLRAQGHTAEMPRLFSPLSSMGLMFWYAPLSK